MDFWILAEKILGIDEMDLELRDHYLSLLLVLKATHLQEGSRVVTLCNMNISKNYKVLSEIKSLGDVTRKTNPVSDSPQSLALHTATLSMFYASAMPVGNPTRNRGGMRETSCP